MSRLLSPPRFFVHGLLAVCTFSALSACGPAVPGGFEVDDGIADVDALTALATPCAFVPASGVATVTMASDEIALVSRRVIDSAILVNGVACGVATATSMKRLSINGAGGDETVIVDFSNGSFGAGTAAAPGIAVDLGAGIADALKFRGQKVTDTITFGTTGINTGADAVRDVTFAGVEVFVVSAGDGNDVISGAGGAGTGAVFTAALTIFGAGGNDTLTGGSGDDVIFGGDGNDILAGGDGDDTLDGGAGNDTFNEGAVANGSDIFIGGPDVDTVSYALRTGPVIADIEATSASSDDDGELTEGDDIVDDVEVVIGGTADDFLSCTITACTLTGGPGDDVLIGGSGNDTLNGGLGNDTLIGGLGDDIENGDAGNDVFDEGAVSNGKDVFNGGAGIDTVDYGARTDDLTITMDGVAANDGLELEQDNVKADIENIRGGAGDDTITGNALANLMTGGDGDDVLNGGAGDDIFFEGSAASGADVFNGGLGSDTIDYSARTTDLAVSMDGVAADDGAIDADSVTLGLQPEGDDVKADVENFIGGSGDDVCIGNALDNHLVGGDGDDSLSGLAGNDLLEGGAGDDTLLGGAGDDTLDGEAGTDSLDGGAGEGDICFETAINCEL